MESDTSTAMTSSRSAALWASAGPTSGGAAKASTAHSATAAHPTSATSLPDTCACGLRSPNAELSQAATDRARPRHHTRRSLEPEKFSTALQVLCPVFHDIGCRDCYCPTARNVPRHGLGCTWRTRKLLPRFAADEPADMPRVCR